MRPSGGRGLTAAGRERNIRTPLPRRMPVPPRMWLPTDARGEILLQHVGRGDGPQNHPDFTAGDRAHRESCRSADGGATPFLERLTP